jgi:hypothetical protein
MIRFRYIPRSRMKVIIVTPLPQIYLIILYLVKDIITLKGGTVMPLRGTMCPRIFMQKYAV